MFKNKELSSFLILKTPPPEDILVLDESGSNIAMTRAYARAKEGERAHAQAPRNWGKNITMLGVLALSGVKTSMVVEGSMNGTLFLAFVKEWLVPLLKPGQVVIMDNLRTHKVAGVREAIEAVGAKVLYLPPYSPDFSPIEQMWSKVKAYLRGVGARTKELLLTAILAAFATIALSDILGWFKHCGYNVQ